MISILAVAFLLAGCGGAATPPSATSPSASSSAGLATESFVGTWRMNSGDRVRWVISERRGKYTVLQGAPGNIDYVRLAVLKRRGNQLSGSASISTADVGTYKLRIGKVPGQMLFTFDATNMSSPLHTTLTKLSGSTATPTPVP